MNGIIGGVFLLTVLPGLWAPIEYYWSKMRRPVSPLGDPKTISERHYWKKVRR